MDSDRWSAPDLEPNRLWHQPEVLIYNNSVFPGVSCTASAYDVANRRWYELNVDSVVRDEDDWMSDTITKHITEYYSKNGALPDFNVINTTREGSPTTFEKKPNDHVARRIQGNFRYGHHESDILPTTTFDKIKRKTYLSCSSDRCEWEGLDCVFKRIEFVEDLEVIEREVRMREQLLGALKDAPGTSTMMQDHFSILPILAVVYKHAETNEVLGLLFPYGGISLETLAGGYKFGMGYSEEEEDEEEESGEIEKKESRPEKQIPSPVSTPPLLPIMETHFQSLVVAIWELDRVGVLHGDINDRNTLLTPDNRLVFVDLGEIAPEYKGDAYALGSMMNWVLDRVDWNSAAVNRIRTIAKSLQQGVET